MTGTREFWAQGGRILSKFELKSWKIPSALPSLKKVHPANCLDMPSPLSYVTLVSTALSCQRIRSSQVERSDTLCVPWLQIVPDWRSTNMMYMIVSFTGDVGRLWGGHQQDPVRHSRELDHTTSVAEGTSMRIKLMTICVILHNSFMQLHMFVSITF